MLCSSGRRTDPERTLFVLLRVFRTQQGETNKPPTVCEAAALLAKLPKGSDPVRRSSFSNSVNLDELRAKLAAGTATGNSE